ncbi:MAG: HAD-IIA family hydrolase [Clostridiales bacterium]|jgi:4-nitrophenyl phosphatase|nr:HAD-IIA family hydrolase [Clostridiales bacterium]HOB63531.1 HAD-IIA family hydrolase [Clostridia bacterium]HOK82155.1 HAD-IIA family hydrolase [Clostridia bacterium]HOL61165.1 HAD-IIA family hydrolase [Clostridia bacterium]HPO53861.1 HAD-IIA family hydrolase [Clostridia bacterium]
MELKIDAEVFLFDLDGTVYLGDQPIDGAIETLKMLTAMGKKVFFLTNNSSKDKSEYVLKLNKIGYPAVKEQVLTSTMATIQYLNTRRKGKSVYPIGTPTFVAEIKAAGIEVKEDADIVLLAFDTTLTYDKIWKANILLEKGREFMATHPDIVCPSDIGDMPDVGALMALLECSCGRAPSVICGKPYSPMAEIINSIVNVEKEKIVMVGDRLYTDILFGINNGYQSLLVLSGETTPEMLASSGIQPTHVLPSVKEIIA